jgi:hypothetical protein
MVLDRRLLLPSWLMADPNSPVFLLFWSAAAWAFLAFRHKSAATEHFFFFSLLPHWGVT